jgi:hypothetical protein
MAWDVEAIRAALAQIGQPKGPTMAAPVGVDPQQAADMAAQSYGVMNNVMNRISNPSMIGRSPMFTAPSSSVLTPRSSGSIPMPTPAQPYQGTLPAGFDQGKAIEKMGLLGNARQQQQGYTIGDIIKLLGQLGAGASSAGQGGGGPVINPGAANPTGGFSGNPYGGGGYGGLGIGNPGSYGGINDPALTSVGLYSGVGSDWGGSRNEWGGIDHERSSGGPGRGVGGR